jgi:hypothetical protein
MFNHTPPAESVAVTAPLGSSVVSSMVPDFVYYSVLPFTHFVAVHALRNATVKESVTTESMKAESDATHVYFRNLNNKTARQRFNGNDRSHRASTRNGTYTDYLLRAKRSNENRRAAFTAALEATND